MLLVFILELICPAHLLCLILLVLSLGSYETTFAIAIYYYSARKLILISARQQNYYAIARYMLSPVRLSVCPSVTRVDQSKTLEVRIMQLSPQVAP